MGYSTPVFKSSIFADTYFPASGLHQCLFPLRYASNGIRRSVMWHSRELVWNLSFQKGRIYWKLGGIPDHCLKCLHLSFGMTKSKVCVKYVTSVHSLEEKQILKLCFRRKMLLKCSKSNYENENYEQNEYSS